MIRKVRFPLKLKITMLITLLLLASISFYVLFALELFKADKSAYVYDDGLKNNEIVSSQVTSQIEQIANTIAILDKTDDKLKVFDSIKNFIEYSQVRILGTSSKREFYFYNKDILDENGYLPDHLEEVSKLSPYPLSKIMEFGTYVQTVRSANMIPHLMIGTYDQKAKTFSLARVNLGGLEKVLTQNEIYNSFVTSSDGAPFLNLSKESFALKKHYIKEIISNASSEGMKEFSVSNERFLTAFKKIKKFNLIVISEIKRSAAFKTSEFLISKSIYFGIFILSISVIIGIVFARNLTTHLDKLFGATKKVASGDFEHKLQLGSSDEIGALSDSFNMMSKEIIKYMKEMEEKARLKNELEVAKLVQKSFFPASRATSNDIELAAFYRPATECGGDWWNFIENGDETIFFIADATGHGVSAAFLTATANCCAENLKYLAKISPEVLHSPDKILQFMNGAVCSIGEDILMTCFVGIINNRTGEFKYSNASHNPPLILRKKDEVATKDDFIPLLGKTDPRLGQSASSSFNSHSFMLEERDSIIMFTDGILECSNEEEKQWGQRKFLKSILASCESSASKMVSHITDEAFDFYGDVALDDDITLLIAKYKADATNISFLGLSDQFKDEVCDKLSDKGIRTNCFLNTLDIPSVNAVVLTPEVLTKYHDKLSSYTDRVIVVSTNNDESNILDILHNYKISHLIGGNSKTTIEETSLYLARAIHESHSSTVDYLGDDSSIYTSTLTSSDEINDKIDQAVDNFSFDNMFDSPVDYIKTMANELLTNAFFHSSEQSAVDRKKTINLSEDQSILFKIGVDSSRIIISVTDKIGKLSREKLVESIRRGFAEKTPQQQEGGAGLGLYLCFCHSNQLVVNIVDSTTTEIMCIIDVNKRYRQYKERVTSLHYNFSGDQNEFKPNN